MSTPETHPKVLNSLDHHGNLESSHLKREFPELGIDLDISSHEGERYLYITNNGFPKRLKLEKPWKVQLVNNYSEQSSPGTELPNHPPMIVITEPNSQLTVVPLVWSQPHSHSSNELVSIINKGTNDIQFSAQEIESEVKSQLGNPTEYRYISFSESNLSGKIPPDDEMFLVHLNTGKELEWYLPKSHKLKRTPLKQYMHEQGIEEYISFEDMHQKISVAETLLEPEIAERPIDTQLAEILSQTSPDLKTVLEKHWASYEIKDQNGIEKLRQFRKKLLVEIGRQRKGIPFDLLVQDNLDASRMRAQGLKDEEVNEFILTHFREDPNFYRGILKSSTETKRAVVSWLDAALTTENYLILETNNNATAEEIAQAQKSASEREKHENVKVYRQKQTTIVDANGDRLPFNLFFNSRKLSPLTFDGLSSLPLRPIVHPQGKPEKGDNGLAEFIFDQIIYSPEVCEKSGNQVGISPQKRAEYIRKIEDSIKNDAPIVATEYLPMIAVANPVKRNTQAPALAEIDLVRRRAEILHTVEMFYSPGMIWMLGNEAPAFQGPMFGLPEAYVEEFQAGMKRIIDSIQLKNSRIQLFDMSQLLWGNERRKLEWENYRDARLATVREAFHNPLHTEHSDVKPYINTFIYPMVTCINPYKIDLSVGLSMEEIMQVYTKIRRITGSEFKGADVTDEANAQRSLSDQQNELVDYLYNWGAEISLNYRTAMDSRDVLPAFAEFIPGNALAHTIISKKEKLVLFPNSGKGAFFPAHGEPILLPSQKPNQRTRVTVRPWWQIASSTEKYSPVYIQDREEPLYFEEVS